MRSRGADDRVAIGRYFWELNFSGSFLAKEGDGTEFSEAIGDGDRPSHRLFGAWHVYLIGETFLSIINECTGF